MAIQRSSVKLEGKVGDLSFYKVDNEYYAKHQVGHSKERIANDPSFERTRENANEFGTASVAAKKLKQSLIHTLKSSLELFQDGSLTNRLVKRMNSTIKADVVNERGKRELQSANLKLFTGFSMNSAAALKDVFFLSVNPEYLMQDRSIRLQIPGFNPIAAMDVPKKATAFRFHFCVIANFNGEMSSVYTETSLFSINTPVETQILNLEEVEAGDLMIFFGASFYSIVAGYPVPLTTPSKNALDIVKVCLTSSV